MIRGLIIANVVFWLGSLFPAQACDVQWELQSQWESSYPVLSMASYEWDEQSYLMVARKKDAQMVVMDIYPVTISESNDLESRQFEFFYLGEEISGMSFDPHSQKLLIANAKKGWLSQVDMLSYESEGVVNVEHIQLGFSLSSSFGIAHKTADKSSVFTTSQKFGAKIFGEFDLETRNFHSSYFYEAFEKPTRGLEYVFFNDRYYLFDVQDNQDPKNIFMFDIEEKNGEKKKTLVGSFSSPEKTSIKDIAWVRGSSTVFGISQSSSNPNVYKGTFEHCFQIKVYDSRGVQIRNFNNLTSDLTYLAAVKNLKKVLSDGIYVMQESGFGFDQQVEKLLVLH
ncbi:MAG: hypothetical protein R3A11_04835 [Bdellovibrionota bacterium]